MGSCFIPKESMIKNKMREPEPKLIEYAIVLALDEKNGVFQHIEDFDTSEDAEEFIRDVAKTEYPDTVFTQIVAYRWDYPKID